MPWKPESYSNPIEFDRRVREPHRNKVWTASVIVLTDLDDKGLDKLMEGLDEEFGSGAKSHGNRG